MSINQILVKNLTNTPLPIQAPFSRTNQFSQILGVGKTVDLGPVFDPATVSRSPEIQNLIAKGKISVTYIVGTTDLAPIQGAVDAQGRATAAVLRFPFTAGAGGSADDVLIYTANSPGMRIVDSKVDVSTAVGGSTLTLRTAIAGGGSAVSDAFSTATTGVKRQTTAGTEAVLAAGSTLTIRRSDSGLAGTVVLTITNS